MEYKAKILGSHSLSLRNKNIVLPISVGQEYHEGEKFAATIRLVEKTQCASCSILVADELQRYNYLDDATRAQATANTYLEGTRWLDRNTKFLTQLTIPPTIIRWKECIQHKEFSASHQLINKLIMTNKSYRVALENDINEFINRKNIFELQSNHDNKKLVQSCQHYLVEETAVLLSYFVDAKFDCILYPSKMPQSIEVIINSLGIPLHCFKIYFKKRNERE